MPFSTLFLSGATVGMTTLAFAISTPASAQEPYAHKHYAHAHYRHYAHHRRGSSDHRSSASNGASAEPGLRLGACGGGRRRRGGNRPGRAGRLYRRRRHCGRGPGRSVWRHGGALRVPVQPDAELRIRRHAELRIRRPFRCAVQCGRGSGRITVPGGGRRFRRDAGRQPRLLSRFRLRLSGPCGRELCGRINKRGRDR